MGMRYKMDTPTHKEMRNSGSWFDQALATIWAEIKMDALKTFSWVAISDSKKSKNVGICAESL